MLWFNFSSFFISFIIIYHQTQKQKKIKFKPKIKLNHSIYIFTMFVNIMR